MRPDAGNEDLRAQVKTLQYELDALKQERDVAALRHEQAVRDARAQAATDAQRQRASEDGRNVPAHRHDALARELQEAKDRAADERHALEKQLRAAKEQAGAAADDADEARSETAALARQHALRLKDAEAQHGTLEQALSSLQSDLTARDAALATATQRLAQREAEAGELEAEVLRLRAQGGDGAELATVRRELGEQVEYLRRLEAKDREQTSALRQLRQNAKAVAIVEEEKRGLEVRLNRMGEVERERGEAVWQRQRLEQEREAWAAFLREEGAEEFDSPEAVARALTRERAEKATLADRVGRLQEEAMEKEGAAGALEAARARLQGEVDKLKAAGTNGVGTGSSEGRSRARLERQKALAAKEVEYLREQLRTFEADDVTGEPRTDADEQARQRVAGLDDLVTRYKSEVESLQAELATLEPKTTADTSTGKSLKRPAPDDGETKAQTGELSRKNRKLQGEIATLTQNATVAAAELTAAKAQLSALQQASKTRVLTLRANPTDDVAAAKLSALAALREENKALHAQLQGHSVKGKQVPAAYFDAANTEIAELQAAAAERDKRTLRLKQVWARTSLEFREAVASLLGWKMDFLPNGRFRMTSLFYPSVAEDGEEEGAENSLIFNGESGIMKISGGPESAFGREIRPLIRFWVEARKEIPAFMAACTLEFYEKTTRAQRM